MEERSVKTMSLDGGCPSLDFVNTVHDRTVKEEEAFDYLSDYNDLLEWSVRVEIITLPTRAELESIVGQNPEKVKHVMNHVIETREILYDFFRAIARNKAPDEKSQERFNALLREALGKLHVQIGEDLEIHQSWPDKSDLKYPLYPVIKSAWDLLISDRPDRIKECGACGWLFLDQSKNKSRKWCSMETCGSNVKAKRYYHRKKKREQ